MDADARAVRVTVVIGMPGPRDARADAGGDGGGAAAAGGYAHRGDDRRRGTETRDALRLSGSLDGPQPAAYAQHLGASGLTFYDDEAVELFAPHAQGKSAIFHDARQEREASPASLVSTSRAPGTDALENGKDKLRPERSQED